MPEIIKIPASCLKMVDRSCISYARETKITELLAEF